MVIYSKKLFNFLNGHKYCLYVHFMNHYGHNMDVMVTFPTMCSKLKFHKTITRKISTHNSELDCQYLRGKYSIVENLPIPAVTKIDNCSYCSVEQCV